MTSARALMRLHVGTLFVHDDDGRLVRVNESGGAAPPRFFLGRTAKGNEWRFRDDLGADVVNDLTAACLREPVPTSPNRGPALEARFLEILGADAPVTKTWRGPAYRFPKFLVAADEVVVVTPQRADVLRRHFGEWVGDVVDCQPFVAVLEGDDAVAICATVRKTEQAHEAGVETHAEFRGRGFAARVVARWATVVRQLGSTPLYSTSWENVASLRVAAKLDLAQFGMDFHVT